MRLRIRHLKRRITEEEDARPEAEGGRRKTQILVHGQRGEADIDAIEIGDEVAEDQEGHEALRDLGERERFQTVHCFGPLDFVETRPWC